MSMLSHLAEGFPNAVAKLTMQVRIHHLLALIGQCTMFVNVTHPHSSQYRMHEDIQSLSNIIGE